MRAAERSRAPLISQPPGGRETCAYLRARCGPLGALLLGLAGCSSAVEERANDAAITAGGDASDGDASVPDASGVEDAKPLEAMDSAQERDATTEDGADAQEPGQTTCTSGAVQLEPVGVDVVVSMHRSQLGSTSWSSLHQALSALLQDASLNVGAHVFWADVADVETAAANLNFCGDLHNELLAPAPRQGQRLLTWFEAQTPAPSTSPFLLRPILDGLGYFLESEALRGRDRVNYLVLISDGADNCFGATTPGIDSAPVYRELASELSKRRIRVVPIDLHAQSQAQSGGSFTQLDLLARHGGAGLERALSARDDAELSSVMAGVARSIRSCRYTLRSAGAPHGKLALRVDGRAIARDRAQANGWDFVEHSAEQIEVFGEACDAIREGAQASARFDCSGPHVCGTAAGRVEARKRPLLFLLDASISMATCLAPGETQDEALQCVTGQIPSWWEVAADAIAESLTVPGGDHVDFALRMFPGSQTGDGCEPALTPPATAGVDAELSMLRSLYATVPQGSTPLVVALELVAQDAGALTGPEGAGALVVLSDGREICSELSSAQSAQRLFDASQTLASSGVRVYPIRIGADSDDAASQDANLRAIASGGGTQLSDPSGAPYWAPRDRASLIERLEQVKRGLRACSIHVSGLDGALDRSRLELYLNNQLVPFDARGEKRAGWGWVDAEEGVAELYGESCTQLARVGSARAVLELACDE